MFIKIFPHPRVFLRLFPFLISPIALAVINNGTATAGAPGDIGFEVVNPTVESSDFSMGASESAPVIVPPPVAPPPPAPEPQCPDHAHWTSDHSTCECDPCYIKDPDGIACFPRQCANDLGFQCNPTSGVCECQRGSMVAIPGDPNLRCESAVECPSGQLLVRGPSGSPICAALTTCGGHSPERRGGGAVGCVPLNEPRNIVAPIRR